MTLARISTRLSLAVLWTLMVGAPAFADDFVWKPVDDSQLAQKSPIVEKDADAEVIFWEVRVETGDSKIVLSNYIRIKIFTERGKESEGSVTLPYFKDDRIEDVAGRTIKADGSIVDLQSSAVFEQMLAKARGLKLRAKSFALPAVDPGVVIEYRWREIQHRSVYFVRLEFQREIPVQLVRYSIKAPSTPFITIRTVAFGGHAPTFRKEKENYYETSLINVPSFRREPQMAPEGVVRRWALMFFEPAYFYQQEFAKMFYDDPRSGMKVDDEVKRTANVVIGDASTPEQKLERLYEFCRTQIKNSDDDASGLSDSDRSKLKENKHPSDTLKRGRGSGYEIDLLFGALAAAAGFDARIARVADRSDTFFDPKVATPFIVRYFLTSFNVAVRVGNDWQFFDPAGTYIPFGMLRWQEEGMNALIPGPFFNTYAKTPASPPEKSLQKRVATLRLTEDGTLEGDVRIEYTGHFAIREKEANDDKSQVERETALRDAVKERMSEAQLSNIQIENAASPTGPFIYSYHIRAPNYAERTGRRLFLQPAFFQKGIPQLFAASERHQPVYFHFQWSEDDIVSIELPAGYSLDSADAPAPLNMATLLTCETRITLETVGQTRTIILRRRFLFGEGGWVLFPVSMYPSLKELFDALHQHDDHKITLKQEAAKD